MAGYEDITRVSFPQTGIDYIYQHLRDAGSKGMECVALLAGTTDQHIFQITTVIVPQQEARRSPDGLSYHVKGEELERINYDLYKKGLKLFGQIHSHPSEAYHSEADDELAIITTLGGLSIVVPYFAEPPCGVPDWAVYRLTKNNYWLELDALEVQELILIT